MKSIVHQNPDGTIGVTIITPEYAAEMMRDETADEFYMRLANTVPPLPPETKKDYLTRVLQQEPLKEGESLDAYLDRVSPQYPIYPGEALDAYVTRVSVDYPMRKALTEQQLLDQEAAKVLPAGVTRLADADASNLPPFEHQDCWRVINGVVAVDLDLYKAKKKDQINARRDTAITTGQDVTYNGNVFDGDAAAQANVTKALTACQHAGAVPTGFTWRSKDNKDIPFTLDDLQALANIMFQFGDVQYAKSWQLKAQVDAATDIASVDAVTW